MVLMAFRHGLRASELVDLRWDQIDLEHALLHVRRLKNGSPATHPLTGKELRALRRIEREQDAKSPFVFTSEGGTPFTKRGFQAMVERAGKATGFNMKIHRHMLRHACGFKLANDGVDTRTIQAYLGHKSIQHAVRYTSWHRLGSKAYSGTDRTRGLASAAPLPEARRIFQENLDECSMGPFWVGVPTAE